MQEMDLDELDQAVGKLMDQASKGKTKKTSTDESSKPADAPVAVKTDDKPADDSASIVTVRRSVAQIMPRKNGIAMDIVQSKPSTNEPPSLKAARVAPTLQPSKIVTPEPVVVKPPEPKVESEPKPEEPKEKADVTDDTLASLDMHIDGKPKPDLLSDPDHAVHKSVWPDPLEMHGYKGDADKPKDETMVNPEIEDPAKPATGAAMEHAAPAITPHPEPEEEKSADKEGQASPFVPTKVEKRPLGAYVDAKAEEPAKEPTKEEVPVADDKKETEDDAQSKFEPASIAVQTPKELSPEVVAVESAEPEFTPDAPEQADETDMNNLRQMAIPQQYQDKDKKPSDKDRPIFDTKDYHPALKPNPAIHKGSKAGTIVTIILILLMVAAAAVAYFTVTGTLDLSRLL